LLLLVPAVLLRSVRRASAESEFVFLSHTTSTRATPGAACRSGALGSARPLEGATCRLPDERALPPLSIRTPGAAARRRCRRIPSSSLARFASRRAALPPASILDSAAVSVKTVPCVDSVMVTGAVSQTTSTASNNNNMGSGNAPSTTAVAVGLSLSAADNGVEVPPTAPAAPRRGSENRRVSPENVFFFSFWGAGKCV